MSVDGTKLFFEGFLQKRKDTLKIRWVTYWFRLQNATLFFYTKKNGNASHLKGSYYIHTVQSVREVQRADSKRFMFEINMKNGKRKMLAADTAALRKEWLGHLWQAMHLCTSRASECRSTTLEQRQQRDRFNSIAPISSTDNSLMPSLPARPYSAPYPDVQSRSQTVHVLSPLCLSEEEDSDEPTYQNVDIPSASNDQYQNGASLNNPQWSSLSRSAPELKQEGDYDVLPPRKRMCEINIPAQNEEDLYDTPLSYRRCAEQQGPTEGIYDVPSSLLRGMSNPTVDEQHKEETYWRI